MSLLCTKFLNQSTQSESINTFTKRDEWSRCSNSVASQDQENTSHTTSPHRRRAAHLCFQLRWRLLAAWRSLPLVCLQEASAGRPFTQLIQSLSGRCQKNKGKIRNSGRSGSAFPTCSHHLCSPRDSARFCTRLVSIAFNKCEACCEAPFFFKRATSSDVLCLTC